MAMLFFRCNYHEYCEISSWFVIRNSSIFASDINWTRMWLQLFSIPLLNDFHIANCYAIRCFWKISRVVKCEWLTSINRLGSELCLSLIASWKHMRCKSCRWRNSPEVKYFVYVAQHKNSFGGANSALFLSFAFWCSNRFSMPRSEQRII